MTIILCTDHHLTSSTAIISAHQWDILDFEDVGKGLANKLSDNDLCSILQCINAQDVYDVNENLNADDMLWNLMDAICAMSMNLEMCTQRADTMRVARPL